MGITRYGCILVVCAHILWFADRVHGGLSANSQFRDGNFLTSPTPEGLPSLLLPTRAPLDSRQGLTGKEMLTEAKILCVADVVETIASHRPYRPGLGLDQALKEITHNRGKLYDAKVVDACLTLFHKKRFEFQSQRQFVHQRINGQ